jgi:hypothetical protein
MKSKGFCPFWVDYCQKLGIYACRNVTKAGERNPLAASCKGAGNQVGAYRIYRGSSI